jgi:hypothetical protein
MAFGDLTRSPLQRAPHGLDYLATRREYAKKRSHAGVDNALAVYENLELPVVSPNHLDIGLQFTTKSRRHTDGVQSCYSICAIPNSNPSHSHVNLGYQHSLTAGVGNTRDATETHPGVLGQS